MRIIAINDGYLGMAFERNNIIVWGPDNFVPEKEMDRLLEFDVIINCVSNNNINWCEEHFNAAFYNNALITKAFSNFCSINNKQFVHMSTGCLYANAGENKETDPVIARNNYEITKWSSEKFCRKNDLIIRLGPLFGVEHVSDNFLYEATDLEARSYASTDVVVNATMALIGASQNGIFNVACDGAAIIEKARIKEVSFNDGLSLNKLKNFYKPPKMQDEIIRCLGELSKIPIGLSCRCRSHQK